MPGSQTPLPGLLLLLGLIFAYKAFADLTAPPESEAPETTEERAARLLKVMPDEIARVLPDGRVVLTDGSLRTPVDKAAR